MVDELLFSKFTTQEFSKISKILREAFTTSEIELASFYQKMSQDFNRAGWPPSNFADRGFFQSADSNFQEVCERSPVIAVDLPSLLEIDDGKENKPTVIILGQDPKSDQDSERIRIGTPYALHLKNCREKLRRTKLYFDMVSVLFELGYRVYLTDIFKVWVCDPRKPYYRAKLPHVDQSRFSNVLRSELRAIEPTALVTWGKDATNSISSMKLDVLHLSFLHPSGAAGGAWKQLLGKSPTDTNKLEYWKLVLVKTLT